MKRDGWQRASILANTRPDRLPDRIGPGDLLYPGGHGRISMFLLCGVGGFCLSIIVVLGPLTLFAAFTPVTIPPSWFVWAEGAGWAALWLGLFVAAIREEQELERWLAEQ